MDDRGGGRRFFSSEGDIKASKGSALPGNLGKGWALPPFFFLHAFSPPFLPVLLFALV